MKDRRFLRLLFPVIYIAMIFAFIPLGRGMVTKLSEKGLLSLFMALGTSLSIVLLFLIVLRSRKGFSCPDLLVLPILLFSSGWTIRGIPLPQEKIHFLQYFFLPPVLSLPLLQRFRERAVIPAALGITALTGLADEGIQYLLPGRVFDPRDILMNLTGGFSGSILLSILLANRIRRGLRWLEKRFSLPVLLSLLCILPLLITPFFAIE